MKLEYTHTQYANTPIYTHEDSGTLPWVDTELRHETEAI